MKKHFYIFSLCLILLVSLSNLALASQEDIILDKIEKRLEEITSLQVNFVQEVSSGVFATIDKTKGKIYIESGDKFRIEAEDQTIVSDSIQIWIYSVENKQVKIDSVHKIDDLVRPSEYLFTFKDGYTANLSNNQDSKFENCYKIVLTSDQDDKFIREMVLYIDSTDYLTRQAQYKDINGNLVTIKFEKYKINKKIPPAIFKFKTPKGVDEVRLP